MAGSMTCVTAGFILMLQTAIRFLLLFDIFYIDIL